MNAEKSVIIPEEILEIMTIERTCFTPDNPHHGIIILTEIEDNIHIVHIYELRLLPNSEQYEIVQELAAFSFINRPDVDDFVERLPNMSAFEMLMLLNPMEEVPSNIN